MWSTGLVILFGIGVPLIQCELIVVSLSKCNWTVTSQNQSISTAANVPGGIYTDLRRGNILKEDHLYRFNDHAYRWVGKTGWTYSTKFNGPDEKFLSQKNQFLVLHGVDTIAKVVLNGEELGVVDNMFVRYRIDVKKKLKKTNTLKIIIASPIHEANKIVKSLPHGAPPNCTPDYYRGECHINVLRKMQASFAWDWAPAFPSMGIWKDVELESNQNGRFRDILTDITYHEDIKSWHIAITSIIETSSLIAATPIKAILTSELNLGKTSIKVNNLVTLNGSISGEIEVQSSILVNVTDVALWWPNGYGDQPLYELEVSLASGTEITCKKIKIGFRTVELVQEPVDPQVLSHGLSFYFKVNNVPIYAKGSNVVPLDILPENQANESTIQNLLMSSKQANMNMLRIWGGGAYLSDYFYQLCDELGILVWHDMMFACNTYPVSPEFLTSVQIEVTQNVRRLQYHPCMAVWSGNNEMEAALRQSWYHPSSQSDLYFKEYSQLYVDTMKPIFDKYDPVRPYLTSSPTNGIISDKAMYHIADNPYSTLYGDTHRYDYYSDLWNPDVWPSSRFCSEYGLQSFPQLSTLQKVSTPEDLSSINSEFFSSRQHLGFGSGAMKSEVSYQFDTNKISVEYYLYLTQVYQAQSIKSVTEKMRREKSILTENGDGLTMGALYWQLNDVWQAPSWSSIDYDGNWKMLHFFAVKFFAPVIISPYYNTSADSVEVAIISDLNEKLHNITIVTELLAWDGHKTNITFKTKLAGVNENSAEKIFSKPLSELCNKDSAQQFYIKVSAIPNSVDQISIEPNYLFLSPLKDSANFTKDPEVKIKSVEVKKLSKNESQCTLVLTSKYVSLFTWLTLPGVSVKWSDNGFTMLGEQEVTFLTNDKTVTTQYVKDNINVLNIQTDPKLRKALKPSQDPSASSPLPSTQQLALILSFVMLSVPCVYLGYVAIKFIKVKFSQHGKKG